jgi:hypothetical protein
MRSISSIVREVITDSTATGGMRSPIIEAHIVNINTWYTNVPTHLYLEDDSPESVANFIRHGSDRDCIAMASRLYKSFGPRKLIHWPASLTLLEVGDDWYFTKSAINSDYAPTNFRH